MVELARLERVCVGNSTQGSNPCLSAKFINMKTHQQLFTGTAVYYAKYRPGYPPEFFDYIARYFDLNETGRLLDLGCGTGQLTIPFATYFEEVVGLDPEREMIDEARKQAQKLGVTTVKFVLRKAEEIASDLGTFRLTTMGASFHWMKQAEVLQKVYEITEPGGGVVVVSESSSPWWDKKAERWKELRKDVVQKYLGEKRRAGNTFYDEPKEKFEDLLKASSFGGYEVWTHDFERTWVLEEVINFLYSTSFASQRLFGDKLGEFEKELREELLQLKPDGIFKEHVRLRALVARKNSDKKDNSTNGTNR